MFNGGNNGGYTYPGQSMSRVSIPNLIVVDTEMPYKPCYQRTYDINVNHGTLNQLENALSGAGVKTGRPISESLLLANAPDIMNIAAAPGKQILIPNGWDTKRFRWVMLAIETLDSDTLYHYIQGYTDHSEVSFNRNLDPRTTFYINTITTIKKTEDFTRPGVYDYQLMSTYNVITDVMGSSGFQPANITDRDSLIRPQDVYDTLSQQAIAHEHGIPDSIDGSSIIAPGMATTSRKSNNNPISHLTATLNAGVRGKLLSRSSSDPASLYCEASGSLTEWSIARNGFISALYKATGIVSSTSFTLADIEQLSPGIKLDVFTNQQVKAVNAPGFGTSYETESDLHGMDITTSVALTAMNVINGYAAESFLRVAGISLSVVNGVANVLPTAAPQFLLPIPDVRLQEMLIEQFRIKVETHASAMLTQNYSYDLELHYFMDMYTDTLIRLSINHGYEQVFRLATFADSLFTPVITSGFQRGNLLDSYNTLVDRTLGVMVY